MMDKFNVNMYDKKQEQPDADANADGNRDDDLEVIDIVPTILI